MAITGASGGSGKKISTAWVDIKPSMRNFYRDLGRQINGQMRQTSNQINKSMTNMGRTSGKNFGRAFSLTRGSMFSGIAGAAATAGRLAGKTFSVAANAAVKVADIGKKALTVAAGAATLGGGVVAAKGVNRALNIEDARAKLGALKFNAEQIALITQNAMNSVVGTQYSFDAAMGASTQALASGIKEGPELEKYLKLITDVSVVSGADMNDIGYIFNKIQANTRAYAQELNMLADRSIPIYQYLSKEMNMSMLDLRKAMKKGEVSSADFLNAIQKNLGGAAHTAANTTRGWTANFFNSLGRLGAAATEGALPIFMQLMMDLIPVVDAFTKAIKGSASEFWSGFGKKATPLIQNWTKSIIANVEAGKNMFPWMDRIEEFAGKVKTIVTYFKDMKKAIMDSPFGDFIRTNIREVGKFLSHLKPIGTIWTDTILPAIQPFIDIIKQIAPIMANTYATIFTMLQPLLDMFLVMGGRIQYMFSSTDGFMNTWSTLITSITEGIIGFITNVGPSLFSSIKNLISGIGSILVSLMPVIVQIVGKIGEVLKNSGPAIAKLIEDMAPMVAGLATVLGRVLLILLEIVNQVLPYLVSAIGPLLANIVNAVIGVIKNLVYGVGTLFNIVQIVFASIDAIITAIANGLIHTWNALQKVLGKEGNVPLAETSIKFSDVSWDFMTMFDDIPKFARGGTILPTQGGTLGILAEAGRAESVVDTGEMNEQIKATKNLVNGVKSESTIHQKFGDFIVHNAEGMDEAKLRREWEKYIRRAGRTD